MFAAFGGILPTRGSLLNDTARQTAPQQMMKEVGAAVERHEVPEASVSLRNQHAISTSNNVPNVGLCIASAAPPHRLPK
jgi:hypothetical protein